MKSVWLGNLEARALVAELLTNGEAAATDAESLAAERGVPWRNVQRAASQMGVRRQREGFGPGSRILWRLPAAHT